MEFRNSCLRGHVGLGGLLLFLVLLGGCGGSSPFGIVPVTGKVTYEDGSLIDAARVLVTFNPIDAETVDGMTTPGARTSLNIADGTFSEVTTRKFNDGVLVGRHKVVVISYKTDSAGRPVIPSKAVPQSYGNMETTPLEIEITDSGQELEIKVSKP